MLSALFIRASALPLIHILAAYVLLPVLGPYFRSLGNNEAWISLAYALFGVGYIIAGITVGSLIDRYGRRRVASSAISLTIVAYLLYFLGFSYGILVARVLDGVCFGVLTIIGIAVVEDRVKDKERGTKTGIYLTFESAVRLFGPVVGGFLADFYIGMPFLLSAGILFGLLSLHKKLVHEHIHSKKKPKIAAPPLAARLRMFLLYPRLQPLLILGFVIHTTTPIIILFIPLFITGTLGFSYAYAGLAVSLYGASHLLQFMFGHFVDSVGRKRLLTLGCLIYGIALVGLSQATGSIGSVLVFVALAGIGNSLWSVAAVSYLATVSAEFGEREYLFGTYISIAKVGEVLSFLLGGLLVVAVSDTALFATIGYLVLAGSMLSSYLFINLFKKEREERRAAEARLKALSASEQQPEHDSP